MRVPLAGTSTGSEPPSPLPRQGFAAGFWGLSCSVVPPSLPSMSRGCLPGLPGSLFIRTQEAAHPETSSSLTRLCKGPPATEVTFRGVGSRGHRVYGHMHSALFCVSWDQRIPVSVVSAFFWPCPCLQLIAASASADGASARHPPGAPATPPTPTLCREQPSRLLPRAAGRSPQSGGRELAQAPSAMSRVVDFSF